jgi:hypothetical protein
MLGVPFLGIENRTAVGTFVGDRVDLWLVAVASPSGSGSYALWKDGFPPRFFHSSCDGIDQSDVLAVPRGHDHFNLGFTREVGTWDLGFRVEGTLAAAGTWVPIFRSLSCSNDEAPRSSCREHGAVVVAVTAVRMMQVARDQRPWRYGLPLPSGDRRVRRAGERLWTDRAVVLTEPQ